MRGLEKVELRVALLALRQTGQKIFAIDCRVHGRQFYYLYVQRRGTVRHGNGKFVWDELLLSARRVLVEQNAGQGV